MEKRKYDQDEILIRQVLESAYPKNFDILKGIVRVDDEQSPHNFCLGLELVAIELSDDSAYIYFTMDDFMANRLEGNFFVIEIYGANCRRRAARACTSCS